jgi:hypothetical protein
MDDFVLVKDLKELNFHGEVWYWGFVPQARAEFT